MPGQARAGVLADDDVHADRRAEQPGGVHGGRRRPRAGLRHDPGAAAAAIAARSTGPRRCRTSSSPTTPSPSRSTSSSAATRRSSYGNLLTLPLGGGLLYVEPVYVQAEATTSFPLLRKVLVSLRQQRRLRGHARSEALDTVFAAAGRAATPAAGGGTTTPPPSGGGGTADNPALTRRCRTPRTRSTAAEAALKAGDFAAYGAGPEGPAGRDQPGGRGPGQRRPPAPTRRRRARPAAAPSGTSSPSPAPSGRAAPSGDDLPAARGADVELASRRGVEQLGSSLGS